MEKSGLERGRATVKMDRIEAATTEFDSNLARTCGELAVGCSDVGGRIEDVAEDLRDQLLSLSRLEQLTAGLETDQAQVAHATEEAKMLAAEAVGNITQSAGQVSATLSDISQLTGLVERLGLHVTNFAAAMDQVRSVSASIETIAKTTNMLALNASIEAERAGDAGRTFAVVASEVKKLASHTRAATEEIRRTIASLAGEAEGLMREIHAGVEESRKAESGFEKIATALSQAIDLVGLVDGQSDQIARSAALIHSNSQQMRGALQDYGVRVRASTDMLVGAHDQVVHMESLSNRIFHGLVAAGASTDDWAFVSYAMAKRDDIIAVTEAALASGSLTMEQLFDRDYQIVANSKPERFRTSLSDWADAHWRPVLDEIASFDSRVLASVCSGMDGFLPTHITRFSREPTGDVAHDTQFCRNGRIIFGDCDADAKRSSAPFFMAVYRHEGDGSRYEVTRNVYVPLEFNGRRWGDLEVAYII